MATPDIYQRAMVDVLTPELESLIKHYFIMHQFVMTGWSLPQKENER